MKSFRRVTLVALGLLLAASSFVPLSAAADMATSPLLINQFKVTSSNGQFFTLYNPSPDTAVDLANFELVYFNNFDLTKATSSKLIALTGTLAPQSYYMISDDTVPVCYRLTMASTALGFSSTSGFVELQQLPAPGAATGGLVTPTTVDYVSWTAKTSSGITAFTVLPANISAGFSQADLVSSSWLRQPLDAQGRPSALGMGGGSWLAVQPDPNNTCGLVTYVNNAPVPVAAAAGTLLPSNFQPPAKIISLVSDSNSKSGPVIPLADNGLMSPMLTELLPNPASPETDANDEFIELYNPNPVPFDLTGFKLQTGAATTRGYAFPAGTTLPANGFKAFYSAQISISLSNSGTAVSLLDPLGNVISSADAYGQAGDGLAWALADGTWYWTTQPTPDAANVIKGNNVVSAANLASVAAGNANVGGTVQGASTANAVNTADQLQVTPIHPWTLALVAALALLYGLYEYRVDMANRLHQFKKYRAARRTAGE